MHQIRSFYKISIFTTNAKINFCILLFNKFYIFKKRNKSLLKILQKNYFLNLESLCDGMHIAWLCRIFLDFLIVFSVVFYFIHQNRSVCTISIFTTNTKINFCILLFNKFYVFWKCNKSLLKILQKNYFLNLESLCDDMQNNWLCWILLGLSNVFSSDFYFMQQFRSFYMISIFIINTKINFCILLFDEFYVFRKWNKILQKNYFRKLKSFYVMICKINDSVIFLRFFNYI